MDLSWFIPIHFAVYGHACRTVNGVGVAYIRRRSCLPHTNLFGFHLRWVSVVAMDRAGNRSGAPCLGVGAVSYAQTAFVEMNSLK